jgi:hypothetical protein
LLFVVAWRLAYWVFAETDRIKVPKQERHPVDVFLVGSERGGD